MLCRPARPRHGSCFFRAVPDSCAHRALKERTMEAVSPPFEEHLHELRLKTERPVDERRRRRARAARPCAPRAKPAAAPRRWVLFWNCLPAAAALTIFKLLLDYQLGFAGFLDFNSDLNVIFTALVFIMGFILAGTITDFKEAERLPGEIACQLEIMEDWYVQASTMAERWAATADPAASSCSPRCTTRPARRCNGSRAATSAPRTSSPPSSASTGRSSCWRSRASTGSPCACSATTTSCAAW